LTEFSDGFTGSEIEQAVIDALYDAFDAGDDLGTTAIIEAIQRTVPLSVTMAEGTNAMRQWAKHRARDASGDGEARGHGRGKLVA